MGRLRTSTLCVCIGVPAVGLALALALVSRAASTEARASYLIGTPPSNRSALRDLVESQGGEVVFEYATLVSGLSVRLDKAALRAVRESGLAERIERDGLRHLHSHLPDFEQEFVPWGVARIGADAVWSTDGSPDVAPGAVAGEGVLVGVLDTGVDFEHPDLFGSLVDVRGSGVVRDFLFGDDDPSDDQPGSVQGHGTSTAGVIAAVDDEVGVIGVAPRAGIVPYRVCHAERGRGCPISAIVAGLERAVLDGVDVINMSFGGSARRNIEARAVAAAGRAGIVLVASAGNDASQVPQFPAALGTVLAVGATDGADQLAPFTNVGGWVDLVAPGVAIPAPTTRGRARDAFLTASQPEARSFQAAPMTGSAVAVRTADLVLVGHGTLADVSGRCESESCAGKIALVERGAILFSEKVQNVEAAGAIGTVVFNDRPGSFLGTLGNLVSENPVVSISSEAGQLLLGDLVAGAVNVTLRVVVLDHGLVSGTSFAAPHVAGVAALVRSVHPRLAPVRVRRILERTATDLGAPMKDVSFGWGLVDAEAAVRAAAPGRVRSRSGPG